VFPTLVPVSVTVDTEQVMFPELVEVTIGGVVLLVTVTVCEAEQPFPGSVTVNVYVDAVLIVYVAVAGPPVQRYATPVVEELPINVTEVVVHVNGVGVAILIFGIAPLVVTVTVDVAEQPFEASVAVTVYVPGVVTVAGFAALLSVPPFQTIVFPALVPVSVTLDIAQVMFPELEDETKGRVVLLVTVTVCEAEQPFPGSVTVNV